MILIITFREHVLLTPWTAKLAQLSIQNGTVTAQSRLWVSHPGFDSKQHINFLLATMSRSRLRCTQPPVYWLQGFFPQEQSS